MKSTEGKYYIGLDHVRALAAFLVFGWHFIHFSNLQSSSAAFPGLSLISEGHTGVSLFLTLSGYLFAKLIGNKKIKYASFILNRIARLMPLLLVVLFVVGIQRYFSGGSIFDFVKTVLKGAILPTLPNGGWSITVEMHFYVLLPLLIMVLRKSAFLLVSILVFSLLLRSMIFLERGEIQSLSYFTLVGRLDQFILGMIFCKIGNFMKERWFVAAVSTLLFLFAWEVFDQIGGFNNEPESVFQQPIWIVLPTIEASFYAVLIAWYDRSVHLTGGLSQFIAVIGRVSYSIYLLHFFFVWEFAEYIDKNIVRLEQGYNNYFFVIPAFLAMLPIAYLSYHTVEKPFLRFRRRYLEHN